MTTAWPDVEPNVGGLEPDVLRALCQMLGGYTAHDQDCLFALWESCMNRTGRP